MSTAQTQTQNAATPNLPILMASATTASAPPPEFTECNESTPADGLPCIVIRDKRLPDAVAAAIEALIDYNNPRFLFNYDGNLVKLSLACGQRPRLVAFRPADLECELTYAAIWFEEADKGPKPVYPPPLVVHALLGRLAEWASPLKQIAGVPSYGINWQLLETPGYHFHDQIYYHPDHDPLPPLSPQPDPHTVAQAVHLIRDDLLGKFSFTTLADRATAIACLIAPFVRNKIDEPTPLLLIESPDSDKTLLADVLRIPALGTGPLATINISSADNLRKWITAGDPMGRIGASKMTQETMNTISMAIGTNVILKNELAHRILRCRLDPGIQQPLLRGWAKSHRASLIWAALTLVQNWIARGKPDGQIIFGSFDSYWHIIGGILTAAGITGFLSNVLADQHHAEDEKIEWEIFVAAWNQILGDRTVGTQGLDRAILTSCPEMLSITLATTGSERGRRIKLGQELRKRRDAVISGFRIKVSNAPDHKGRWRFHLEDARPIVPETTTDNPVNANGDVE